MLLGALIGALCLSKPFTRASEAILVLEVYTHRHAHPGRCLSDCMHACMHVFTCMYVSLSWFVLCLFVFVCSVSLSMSVRLSECMLVCLHVRLAVCLWYLSVVCCKLIVINFLSG